MGKSEQLATERYEAAGWTVLRKGWPDLFMYKQREDGKLEVKLVEVKGRGDKLSREQKTVLSILSGLGVDCYTYYIATDSEIEGAGEPLKPVCAQSVGEASDPKPPIEQRYQRTVDGGYMVPDPQARVGYKVMYACPVCKWPKHGLKAHQDGVACGRCDTIANGGRWRPYESRPRMI